MRLELSKPPVLVGNPPQIQMSNIYMIMQHMDEVYQIPLQMSRCFSSIRTLFLVVIYHVFEASITSVRVSVCQYT